MRLLNSLFWFFCLFLISSQGLLAVKLKNVVQTGTGSSGNIRIEFNNSYSKTNIKVNYLDDRVDLVIPNAFVVPVKRVFKSSSSKSSVVKMEASNISGRSLRLSIFFRGIPTDIIKKTAKLTGDENIVSFNYSTSLEAASTKEPENVQGTEVSGNVQKSDQADPEIKPVAVKVQEAAPSSDKTIAEHKIPEQKRSMLSVIKKYFFALTKFFKVAILVVLLGLVIFGLFYALRKLSANKPFIDSSDAVKDDASIKIISKLDIEKDKTLYVIEITGERLLIASGKDYVSMLSRLQSDAKDGQASLFNDVNDNNIFHTKLKQRLDGS